MENRLNKIIKFQLIVFCDLYFSYFLSFYVWYQYRKPLENNIKQKDRKAKTKYQSNRIQCNYQRLIVCSAF